MINVVISQFLNEELTSTAAVTSGFKKKPQLVVTAPHASQISNVTQSGYLWKLGPKRNLGISDWKKRWYGVTRCDRFRFVLKGTGLFYYASRNDTVPAGSINVLISKLVELKDQHKDKKYRFDIITPTRTYLHLEFSFVYHEDIESMQKQ